MKLGRFFGLLTGKVMLRLSPDGEYIPAITFKYRYKRTPLWNAYIDTIRAAVMDDVNCFTIILREEESA